MDVELLRPGTARPSHNTVLWFEFLLDPSLLENHLQKETPGNVTLSVICVQAMLELMFYNQRNLLDDAALYKRKYSKRRKFG